MLNFGIRNDHVSAPQQQSEQCSFANHQCRNHSQFHYPINSCCSLQSSCCQSKPAFHSNSSCCHIPHSSCGSTTCHRLTKGYYWRDYIPGDIPHDAVAGIDGQYVGQVSFNSILLPVAIYAKNNTAVGVSFGRRIFKQNIKILCSADPDNIYWEHVNFLNFTQAQVKHAINGGHEDGCKLYIGVANSGGEWLIGKVIPKEKNFYSGLQVCNSSGNTLILYEFHILKYRSPYSQRNAVRQDFYWRDFIPGEIPSDAIKGTCDLYIGQVSYDSCNLPATIYPLDSVAIAERLGKRIFKDNFKILCSPDASKFYWEKCSSPSGRFGNYGQTSHIHQGMVCGFGAPPKQQSSLFGTQQNITTGFGATSNQESSTCGMPQNITACFGATPNVASTFSGMPQKVTSFGASDAQGLSGMSENQTSGLFGVQQNQITISHRPPALQSGTLFGSTQNAEKTASTAEHTSFTFGIPQVVRDPNLVTSSQAQTSGESEQSKNLNETGQINKVSTSENSQNPTNTKDETSGIFDVSSINTSASTQSQDITVESQRITLFGIPQSQSNNENIQKMNTFGGGFSPLSVNSQAKMFTPESSLSGSEETEATSSLFGQSQTQGTSSIGQLQTQGTTSLFGKSQPQGTTASFGQSQTQGIPSFVSQSQTQGTTSFFGQPQPQGTPASFGYSQTQETTSLYGKSQSQGTSASFGQSQTQGTSPFGQSQVQGGGSSLFGQTQTQGNPAAFCQSQKQCFGGPGGLWNNRGNNYTFNPEISSTWQEKLKDNVKGGNQDGMNLYIGKAFHEGEWKVGKAILLNNLIKVLHVWGRFNETVTLNEFEILKYRSD